MWRAGKPKEETETAFICLFNEFVEVIIGLFKRWSKYFNTKKFWELLLHVSSWLLIRFSGYKIEFDNGLVIIQILFYQGN